MPEEIRQPKRVAVRQEPQAAAGLSVTSGPGTVPPAWRPSAAKWPGQPCGGPRHCCDEPETCLLRGYRCQLQLLWVGLTRSSRFAFPSR